jgi:hypothetical protein
VGSIIRKSVDAGKQRAAPHRPRSEFGQRLILKQARLRPDRKRVIGGSQAEPAKEGHAELLYDGDSAVGVRVVCVCGKATEIYFEYGE